MADQWYVVRSNIRCEDRAMKSLRAAGYRVYLPVMKKDIFQRRKKVLVTRKFVLFNRYLFVRDPSPVTDFYTMQKCDGVEKLLGIKGTPIPVPREHIKHFMLAQRRGEFNDLQPKTKKDAARKKFPLGSRIRVHRKATEHPFGGFYAQVTKIKGRGVVQAMLGIFGSMVPVDLRYEDIEPALEDAA
jgi:transcription termination/antitermination protein NusG